MDTYVANYDVGRFLVGRGFSPLSADYRYYYFENTLSLQETVALLPNWSGIWFANGW
jgi:hypothetical protein